MAVVSVVTATYNRAHTLERPFNSLMKQNSKDFEWIVIDDGSTDNTGEIVDGFMQKADFPMYYVKKSNGGRHTALNYSYKYVHTKYVVNLDSDDELTENAIKLMIETWKSLSGKAYEQTWLISGRCIDSLTRKMVGIPYPVNINSLTGKEQRKMFIHVKGEKCCCRKIDILRKYPFPEYSDTKFVSEDMIWEKINMSYKQFFTNDIYRVYFANEADSLNSGKIQSTTFRRGQYYYSLFYVNEMFHEISYNSRVLESIVHISRYAVLSEYGYLAMIKDCNKWYKKVMVIMFSPISLGWILYRNANLKRERK